MGVRRSISPLGRGASSGWSEAPLRPSRVSEPVSSEAGRPYTPPLVADLPIDLSNELGEQLSRCSDVERKIPRALEALGPVAGRDVLLLDGIDGMRAGQLRELGARVTLAGSGTTGSSVADRSVDLAIDFWPPAQGAAPDDLAEAERVLRPGGRLLVVHDYGRDDVSHLRGDRPEYGAWSRRSGPLLNGGFKVRVVHCFWTFETIHVAGEFLAAAFDEAGRSVAAGLKRPRLSWNVAIYHRTFGEPGAGEAGGAAESGSAEAGGADGAADMAPWATVVGGAADVSEAAGSAG